MDNNSLGPCPKLMDDVEYGIFKGIYKIEGGQLKMIETISYQDCVNYKANYKIYVSSTKKDIKTWEKEKIKQESLNLK